MPPSPYARFCARAAEPHISLVGTLVFAGVWFLLGGYSEAFPPGETTADGYLPWHRDYLGHFLLLLLGAAVVVFFVAAQRVYELCGPVSALVEQRAIARTRIYLPIGLVLAVGLTLHNVRWIQSGPTGKVWWSEALLPTIGPTLVAGSYYLLALLPLVLAQVKFGFALAEVGRHAEELDGIHPTDPDGCFGLSPVGNAVAGAFAFTVTWCFWPLIVQLYMHGNMANVTFTTYLTIFLGLLLSAHLCLIPGYHIIRGVARVRAKFKDLAKERGDHQLLMEVKRAKGLPLTRRSVVYIVAVSAPPTIRFVIEQSKALEGLFGAPS